MKTWTVGNGFLIWVFCIGCLFLCCSEGRAEKAETETTEMEAGQGSVSFRHEVVPILTKTGCNSGTCHGTPTGKNGFRLSLRGYDPEMDFDSLTREVKARRINGMAPEKSLMLQKAIAEVPHQGGRRFSKESNYYRLLHDWIEQGARDDGDEASPVVGLEIHPSSVIVEAPEKSQPIKVVAKFANGKKRDVTQLARLSVNDDSVASATMEGRVKKQKRGEVYVSAEYCTQLATAKIVFTEPVPEFTWSDPPENNFVDRHVFRKLKLLKIEPSGLASDEEFVRRIYLDAIGRLPNPEEVRAFLSDESPGKRERLIDQLLEKPEFAEWWAMKWADRLGCNQRFVGKYGAKKYYRWIRNAMAVNMPHDEFVRRILTASGPNYSNPPAGFWRRLRKGAIVEDIDPRLAAEEISQLFLGVRIQCARCHNHPGERWTQDDYYGLAAFFPRMKFEEGPYVNHRYDREETAYVTRSGELKDPRTGETVVPRVLDGEPIENPDVFDRRTIFADWLTSPENPFFARAAVNRIWYHLFGRGLVEPVDDFRSSNPPSHEKLLDALAEEFVAHNFDRQHIIKTILKSRTYQLSSETTPTNAGDDKYFSHGRIRLLQAEQLMDAICQVTETSGNFPGYPESAKAVSLADGEYKHPFLEAFGRPSRAIACECERDSSTNLSQALHLVSGEFVHKRIHGDEGRAARLAASDLSNRKIVDELFLATLARFPSEEERQVVMQGIADSSKDRRAAVENLLWSLLNHREFLFQH